MTYDELKNKLCRYSSVDIDLVIKDNRSTFLHVVIKKKKQVKLLLHKLFLNAPEEICRAIARYVLSFEENALLVLKKYAQSYFSNIDYSHQIDHSKLKTDGTFYNLKEIYYQLNRRYFNNQFNLSITWFSKPKYKNWSHLTFGSYDSSLKLIRINSLLDDPYVPPYFLSFVIYHEMLHHALPFNSCNGGRRNLHSLEFKNMEKEFYYYNHAMLWEKNNLPQFIRRKKRLTYGWS